MANDHHKQNNDHMKMPDTKGLAASLSKLNKDQKGLLAIVSGALVVLLAWSIIPGLTTILAVAGFALMILGLFLLEIHKKIMSLFHKK